MASKPIQQQSFTTLNEPIKLSKKQNEILVMVCDLYEMKIGEYIKQALIESLKEEITDGEFCELFGITVSPVCIVVRTMFQKTKWFATFNIFFSYCCIFRQGFSVLNRSGLCSLSFS